MLQAFQMQQEFPTLKVAAFGGLPIPTSIVKGVGKLCPSAHLVHLYGMTETAGPVLYHIYNGKEDLSESTPPLSKGHPGTQWKLGIGNEVLLKTPAMTSGYHGNEKGTNELLRDGWVHTGDVGYLDSNG